MSVRSSSGSPTTSAPTAPTRRGREVLPDARLDDDALGRHAQLAGVGEAAEEPRRRRRPRGRRRAGRSWRRCPIPRGCTGEAARPARRRARARPGGACRWRSRRGRPPVGRPGAGPSGSASAPGRSATTTASSGHAPRRASSTSIVVRRTREEGRQTTAFPAARAEEATSGRHPDRRVGRVPAEDHPVGRPLQARRPRGRRHRDAGGSSGPGRAGRPAGRARTPSRGARSGVAGRPRRRRRR